ncbi:MAG TPA: hypothetical protein DCM08_04560 [Microscillaceae bacterium]|nr:hypothetical protein [Microscillaceae bacterium]
MLLLQLFFTFQKITLMKQRATILAIFILTFIVAGKTQAQEFDLKKASGKWVINDIVYDLLGRLENGGSLPPTDEGVQLWNVLNTTKAETLASYQQEQYTVELKETTEMGYVLVESYNSSVFGPRQVVFVVEFTPGGLFFTNGSKIAPVVYLTPSLENDKLKISAGTDKDGLSTTFTFTRAK